MKLRNGKNHYNYVTDNPIIAEELRAYCQKNLKPKDWNPCGYYDGWYFGFELTPKQAEKLTWFIESIVDMVNGEYE